MKIRIGLMVIGLMAASLGGFLVITSAYAQEALTTKQKAQISANCVSIQSTLKQLHENDALLRVNRGQLYESIRTRLMDRFNGRLASNGLDARGLLSVTTNYGNAFKSFQDDYRVYEQSLSALTRIDCAKEPEKFHDALLDTREKRLQVHTDVVRLHRYIDDYRSAVSDFKLNFVRITGTN